MSNEIRKDSAESLLKIEEIAELFHVLGDYSRLRIYLLIAEHDKSVTEIVELTHLSQSNVSHHLKLLKEKELVSYTRIGKLIIYSTNNSFLISRDKIDFVLDISIFSKIKL